MLGRYRILPSSDPFFPTRSFRLDYAHFDPHRIVRERSREKLSYESKYVWKFPHRIGSHSDSRERPRTEPLGTGRMSEL